MMFGFPILPRAHGLGVGLETEIMLLQVRIILTTNKTHTHGDYQTHISSRIGFRLGAAQRIIIV